MGGNILKPVNKNAATRMMTCCGVSFILMQEFISDA